MTMIVGYAPDERGKAALHLAAMLARSAGDDLVVASVVPAPWFPSMARVDAEYHQQLDDAADQALESAKKALPPDVTASFVRHSARSAAAGLLDLAREHDANILVLGSSSAGAFGHVVLGSVTDRLLHSSPVTIALAPRGFRSAAGARVKRATVAYGGSSAASLAVAAAAIAARVGADLRVASFAVWSRPPYTTSLGSEGEDQVLDEWRTELQGSVADALARVDELPVAPEKVEVAVGRGESWDQAIDEVGWGEGDVLVVGSSALGPVAQVFLGSRATKIVRHSPVPVIVVPRERAEELVDELVDARDQEAAGA